MDTRKISDVIDTEYKEYALYTIENRALPSYCDGFKPVHKKLLYAMIKHFRGKKIKVAELGTSIASVASYHHGEASSMAATITLTADWNNVVPLFRGHGNFGSRLIQEAAAPRYIFCDLNPDFYKYFMDFDAVTPNKDIESPEPQQYLPIIPWILVNGIEGIAVGFACKFLSHDPKELAKACILAVNNELSDDYCIPVKLPAFNGEIIQDTTNRIISRGIIERVKRNTWLISEVPWGYDREKFFNHLDKMLDQRKISDFEDRCDDSGFKFEIKMDGECDAKCSENPIEYFKLERAISENYTALDENGNIIIFNNKVEIIRRFVKFRIGKVKEQIEFDIAKLKVDLHWYTAKRQFISDVLDKKIDLLIYKKATLLDYCINEYALDKNVASNLIGIPVYDMTVDSITELDKKIKNINKEIKVLENSDAKEVYLARLNEII